MPRIGIVLMFVLLLVVAGSLLSIPFVVRDPLPILGPQGPVVFEGDDEAAPGLTAWLEVDPSYRFVMVMALEGTEQPDDEPGAPKLTLSTLDHEMPPIEVEMEPVGDRRFRATGTLSMPGRWEASLRQGEVEERFEFILREF